MPDTIAPDDAYLHKNLVIKLNIQTLWQGDQDYKLGYMKQQPLTQGTMASYTNRQVLVHTRLERKVKHIIKIDTGEREEEE